MVQVACKGRTMTQTMAPHQLAPSSMEENSVTLSFHQSLYVIVPVSNNRDIIQHLAFPGENYLGKQKTFFINNCWFGCARHG